MTTLLVVEDDPNIRDLMGRRLQRAGYVVITAVNGVEAILRARRDQPDLILRGIIAEAPPIGGAVLLGGASRRIRRTT